jgi:hypothetical protein
MRRLPRQPTHAPPRLDGRAIRDLAIRTFTVTVVTLVALVTAGAAGAQAATATSSTATRTTDVRAAPGHSAAATHSAAAEHSAATPNGAAAGHTQSVAPTVEAVQPSADLTQPQPLSNADRNSGGANNAGDCGAYCSTRDGSASGNGNGGGKAAGRPCAGCVGKADNKNPPGQRPDASDANNGYECDGNHGIARTNPAHTGCTTPTTTTCVPTPANHNCGHPQVPPEEKPPTTDTPDTPETNQPPTVLGEHFVRTPQSPPTAPETLTTLPFTGAARVPLLLSVSLLAMSLGWLLVATNRRRQGATT